MKLRSVPSYVWTVVALAVGLFLGGRWPGPLAPVAAATAWLIGVIVALVPILILMALSPAVATLVRRGLGGRFAGSVLLWFLLSSALAGLIGLVISSLIFHIPFSTGTRGAVGEAARMVRAFGEQSGASLPLVAIAGAVILGLVGVWVDPLYRFLQRVERGISAAGRRLALWMTPLILLFGITLGVRFGAQTGMQHYLGMTLYTAILCFFLWLFYVFVIMKGLARQPVRKLVTEYWVPVAVFAAGTCSSLVTLPVNLAAAKKYGVRDEVADFVIPVGAIVNMNASALMYVAYAPFVISYIFGLPISWVVLLIATPAIALFTVAAPGLPVGMGTALWSATLYASILGLEEPVRSNFVVTWLALSGGLPDMFRTAMNSTGDGFTAILFDHFFHRFERRGVAVPPVAAPAIEAGGRG